MLENVWRGLAIIYASNKNSAEKIFEKLKANGIPSSLFSYSEVDFEHVWNCYDGIIFVMALGGVVRTICKYVNKKNLDPPIIAIDDSLKYVIPILGAHWGANEIAKEISQILNSELIITTASELQNVTPIEYVAKRLNYKIENVEGVVKVDSALIKGKKVCIIGIENNNIYNLLNDIKGNYSTNLDEDCESIVLVDDNSKYKELLKDRKPDLVLKPIQFSVGIGLKKEATSDSVKEAIYFALKKLNADLNKVKVISSIRERVREVSKELGKPFRLVSIDEINSFYDPCISPQSNKLKELGIKGVAEISALIAGGKGSTLLLRKIPYKGEVTVAIASYEGEE
ncbi:cobalt-precorrin 5A hydrolase [Acidianus sulfidivorans JP7]|uniref:Cobalt-precorrin 5A hydrolase n=1 Tax=Acidianus sulfidivorans JP7 TaxID=619593 RepID=A0A2U9IK42_9CREN|nr:cobalt-precorrin 5A hydrolase [Acidianus sulfidivorans]AWR96294.1 cobalt-precorrin 5A hydrolase [Acidianus sulfidivorans JP7]